MHGSVVRISEVWWRYLDTIRTGPGVSKTLVGRRLGVCEVSEERDTFTEFAPPKPVCRKKRTLSAKEKDNLVEGYRNGKTARELGLEFGVHRRTATVHLKQAGVTMRMQGLDESARPEIARLRDGGWSYARLGERCGVDAATVRRFYLREAQSCGISEGGDIASARQCSFSA
jgi:DNA-directed RNA polymerase specialized sigma24 family protein